MCGIVAIAGLDLSPQPRGMEPALARLAQRGPDGVGTWRSPTARAILGHRRLAIIDLSDAGRQPMVDADGSVAVTFNGEIYNAPALTSELKAHGRVFRSRSDTEVIVHGYRQWGMAGLLERLIGMFAFVVWDEAAGVLHAAVDHAGMKPLYWSCAGGVFHAASDADALRCVLPARPTLDGNGLCHVLCHGYCPPPMTVWRGIQKLAPGQALRYIPGQSTPEVWRHWSPPEEVAAGDPDVEAEAERFSALWSKVVGDHLLSDVPVGVFLSGGIDSTSIALALSSDGKRVDCLTLAVESGDDESPAAAETAAMLGLPHVQAGLGLDDVDRLLADVAEAFDEPQAYGALLTAVRIAQAARKRGKVMIAGDGGDEAFAGYTWHQSAAVNNGKRTAARAAMPPGQTRAANWADLEALASQSFLHAHLQAVFPRFHPREAAAILAPLGPEYDEHTYAAWLSEHDRDALPSPRRAQRLDLMGFCAGSILPKIDRSSMSVGLELRAPFLDRRVLDWALKLPAANRPDAPGAQPKAILRRYLRDRVPRGVLERPKQGFSLRLGQDVWTSRLERLRRSRLVTDGLVHEHWERFVAPDAPYRSSRIFALCMIAAWLEGGAASGGRQGERLP